MQENDALITRARANLVASFLDDPAATHLLFIDADMGFSLSRYSAPRPAAPMFAAVYPIKRIDWEKSRRTFGRRDGSNSGAALALCPGSQDPGRIEASRRVRARPLRRHRLPDDPSSRAGADVRAPSGCSASAADHNYRDALAGSANRVALFECMIDPQTGVYLSEDFSFCRRWTDMGGEIWADLASRLRHVGPSVFRGDVSSQFAAPATAASTDA